MSDDVTANFYPIDWEAFQVVGPRADDNAITRQSSAGESRVRQGSADAKAAAFGGPMPELGTRLDEVYSRAVSPVSALVDFLADGFCAQELVQ